MQIIFFFNSSHAGGVKHQVNLHIRSFKAFRFFGTYVTVLVHSFWERPIYIYIVQEIIAFKYFPREKKAYLIRNVMTLVFMSQLYSFHVTAVQFSCQNCTVFMSELYSFHVRTVWFSCHSYMVSMSQLYGFHVTTVWFPCHKTVKKNNWVSTNTCNQQCIFIFIIYTCDLVILNTNNVINQIFILVLLVLINTVLHTICFWCAFSICWHVKI